VGVRNPAQNVIPWGQDQAALRPIGNPAGRQEAWANEHACIGKEIDMIQVRRTAEHDSFIFEVVVREGNGETRHHVTMSREMCERLTAGKHTPERCLEAAFPVLARARAKGIDPPALRRDGDLALLPRVRAGDATLPFAVLMSCTAASREQESVSHHIYEQRPL
jgi:hypothetical protein